jgi:hypothetical protein
MRTSNFFSIAALVICGMVCVNSVKAQENNQENNVVTVSLKFKPVQSIVVNPDSKTVDLEYTTKENYDKGVSKKMEDHLTVFSTGGFVVNVRSDGNFKRVGDETKFIPASDMKITVENGTDTETGNFTTQNLSTSDLPVITANEGGNELKYSVTYDNTSAESSYKYININNFHSDTQEVVYTAQVTYTITTN